MVCITEHRGADLDNLGARAIAPASPGDASLRVMIDRNRWLALAPAFWEEANRRLRANGLPAAKFQKNPGKPVPVHPSLGKELCILCWAVEDASPDDIPNALRNWEALAPEERWWLPFAGSVMKWPSAQSLQAWILASTPEATVPDCGVMASSSVATGMF